MQLSTTVWIPSRDPILPKRAESREQLDGFYLRMLYLDIVDLLDYRARHLYE